MDEFALPGKLISVFTTLFIISQITKGTAVFLAESNPNCQSISPSNEACYWYESDGETWREAIVKCASKGGNLAVVNTEEAHEEILRIVPNNHGRFWIGLSELATKGVFRWTNGRILGWSEWGTHQPNNIKYSREESCVYYGDDGLWYDGNCSLPLSYLCQSEPFDFYCLPTDYGCAPWIHTDFRAVEDPALCVEDFGFTLEHKDLYLLWPRQAMGDPNMENICRRLCMTATHFVCRAFQVEDTKCRGGEEINHCQSDLGSVAKVFSRNLTDADVYGVVAQGDTDDLGVATFDKAVEACEAMGRQLLTVKTPQFDQELRNNTSWLGLMIHSPGVFKWIDGVIPAYTNWMEGMSSGDVPEPDQALNAPYKCPFRASNRQWVHQECAKDLPYVCEEKAIYCHDFPCYHDGTCVIVEEGNVTDLLDTNTTLRPMCQCEAGYTGKHCEVDIDECESKPCHNGATCVDGRNDVRCLCIPGFLGEFCEEGEAIPVKLQCEENVCHNGGTCFYVLSPENYTCSCTQDYKGKHCERAVGWILYTYATIRLLTNYDDKYADPTNKETVEMKRLILQEVTGQFINSGANVEFINVVNFREMDLSILVDLEIGSYLEKRGYNQQQVNQTMTSILNGTISDGKVTTLPCDPYFIQIRSITQDKDECITAPCLNNGVCQDGIDHYMCTCAEGYGGPNCQFELNAGDCVLEPCNNDGTCLDDSPIIDGLFTCVCSGMYMGAHCENERIFKQAQKDLHGGASAVLYPTGVFSHLLLLLSSLALQWTMLMG